CRRLTDSMRNTVKRRTFKHTVFFVLVLNRNTLVGLAAPGPQGTEIPTGQPSARCAELKSTDFSEVPDALTQVTSATLVNASSDFPEFCEVQGYVAPSVRFRFRLPTESWNGKIIELGCGGTCGSTEDISRCDYALRRGYACIASDGGNSSSGLDMKWAYNNPKRLSST